MTTGSDSPRNAPDGLATSRQISNFIGVVVPLLGFVLAVVLFWGRLVEPIDLAILVVGYVATLLGITVGFHRLLTHRAFQTYPTVRYALAVLGTLAVEGSVIKWVTDHRKHHDFADDDGDPHSPHDGGPGVLGALKGLWHAHVGWLFTTVGQADRRRYGADLLKDRGMRLIDAAEKPLIASSLAIPFLLGLLVKGTVAGALLTLVWGGLVRVFLCHHMTFSINSICHFFGRRRFDTDDKSTNVAWLSLATLGESWHKQPSRLPDVRLPRAASPRDRPRRAVHPRAGAPRPGLAGRTGQPRAPAEETLNRGATARPSRDLADCAPTVRTWKLPGPPR
jgi:stearoyl-CoA desaturase (Delta-9 desaturase)